MYKFQIGRSKTLVRNTLPLVSLGTKIPLLQQAVGVEVLLYGEPKCKVVAAGI